MRHNMSKEGTVKEIQRDSRRASSTQLERGRGNPQGSLSPWICNLYMCEGEWERRFHGAQQVCSKSYLFYRRSV